MDRRVSRLPALRALLVIGTIVSTAGGARGSRLLRMRGDSLRPIEVPRVGESPPSARERLLGTWRVVSNLEIDPDGARRPEPDFGASPLGYLLYERSGHMCAALGRPDPARWGNPAEPTDQERALTHKGMAAYCGTFEVKEKEGIVIHRPELATWPHFVGSQQIRHFHFRNDDELVLTVEDGSGEKRRYEITWRRVR